MAGPHTADLHALAAQHSMSVTRQPDRLLVTRTGPGTPRRLSARVKNGDWEHAAKLLADEIRAHSTPDKL